MTKVLYFEQKINELSVKINFQLGSFTIKNNDVVSNFSMKEYAVEHDRETLLKHFYNKLEDFNADETTKDNLISILNKSI